MLWLKQSYYDQGEKAGKLLAWRLKRIQTDRAINSVKLQDGKILIDPSEINTAFKEFYENLYKSEYSSLNSSGKQKEFLDKLQFPSITNQLLIPNLIANDQNGFVLGMQAFHNTRRLLNILYMSNKMPETMRSYH